MARIIRIDPALAEPEKIEEVVAYLCGDGVMAYPTDTFYGLGANSFSGESVRRVYALKERDRSKPLSVVVADMGMAERIALDPPHVFWTLAREFWPGPFTLVIRARPLFPGEMLGPNDSLAVRIPDHLWLRQLVKKAGFPITATSANISGAKEISRPEEIIEIFKDKLGLIVDGGETPGGLPSTIIDLTCDKPRLIREGAVPSRLFIPYL